MSPLPSGFWWSLCGSTVAGGLTLWIAWRLLSSGPVLSRLRRAVLDDRASSIVEFPFALLLLVAMTLWTCQLVFLATAYLVVDYASFAAARSAAVVIPQERRTDESTLTKLYHFVGGPEEPKNHLAASDIDPSTFTRKGQDVRQAAVLVCYPISDLADIENPTFGVGASATLSFGGMGITASGGTTFQIPYLQPLIDFLNRSDVIRRWVYADKYTLAKILPEREDWRGGQLVTVEVTHQFHLGVPFADRLFRDGKNAAGPYSNLTARSSILTEGYVETIPADAPELQPPPVNREPALSSDRAAGTAPRSASPDRGLAARLRRFHADRRAQILPLVFFLGIAFFTGVILVVNTGQTVNRRIESQNATDAAAVSGATVIARGMNYVASNNVTMAKILSSIIIVRSFEPAIGMSRGILLLWSIAQKALEEAGEATAEFGVGVALLALAEALRIKIMQECVTLEVLRKVTNKIRDFWDGKPDPAQDPSYTALAKIPGPEDYPSCGAPKDADAGTDPKDPKPDDDDGPKLGPGKILGAAAGAAFGACRGAKLFAWVGEKAGGSFALGGEKKGLGWKILKILNKIGLVMNLWTPVEAQATTKAIYKNNFKYVGPYDGVWLVPIFPKMPDCKGKFMDFTGRVTKLVEAGVDVIAIPGWIFLTLSMFPVTYMASTKIELVKMFFGIDDSVDLKITESPSAKHAQEYGDQAKELKKKLKKLKAEKESLQSDLAAEQAKDKPDASKIADLQGKIAAKQAEIDATQGEMDGLQSKINDLKDDPGEGAGLNFKADMGDLAQYAMPKNESSLVPWLMFGTGYPSAFTYVAFGWRNVRQPFLPAAFKRPVFPLPSPLTSIPNPSEGAGQFLPSLESAFTYAAARVYNPTTADMWTPDWRAKLVRLTADLIPLNPLGRLPSSCGCQLLPEVEITGRFDIDILPNWDIDWPFDWPEFDFGKWFLLPDLNIPTSLGKH